MADSVLVVAAHPDDEVLGCGGTIARDPIDGDCQESCHLLEAFYAYFDKPTGRLVCWVANGSFFHTKSGCFQQRIDLLQRLGFAMRASS